MKLDVAQLMRAGDELAKFFYSRGARRVHLSFDFGEERSFCAIEAQDIALSGEDEEHLRHVFAGPIQPEIASYYGSLAGRKRDESELDLLGTMAELEDFIVSEEIGVRIVISRREDEYFGRGGGKGSR
jgi:hypothetical protein